MRLRATELEPVPETWEEDDVILYHLGIGATGLPRAYERDLQVLPTFAATSALSALRGLDAVVTLDRTRVLHGAQAVEVPAPLPTRATVEHRGRVAGLYDKGSGALIVLEVETVDAAGTVLALSRYDVFVRGAGGFGGERGPSSRTEPPERAPDDVVETRTLPQQALLYRLTGDKNPLHADPEFALASGFERPILHGLCTYGIACSAAVDAALDGCAQRVAGFSARFTGVVFPGDTVTTRLWNEPDGIHVEALVLERGETVLAGGRLVTRPASPPPPAPR
jgi:acyl dehydratase